MGRYLDLARRALEDSAEALPYERNEKSEIRVVDPYQKRAWAVLAKIRPDCPIGMIPWLGERHPTLYDELTARLPDEIHRLWAEKAPLEEFERILSIWLEAHRTACELYEKAHSAGQPAERML